MAAPNKMLMYKGRVVFGKQRLPDFNRHHEDHMADEACFMFVNEGSLKLRAPNNTIELSKEHGVLAKCMNYYLERDQMHKQSSKEVEMMAVLLYPEIMEEIFDFNLSHTSHFSKEDVRQVKVDNLLIHFREGIKLLLDSPEIATEEIIRTKLKEFVLLMTQHYSLKSEIDFLAGLFSPINLSFKETVKSNLYANLSTDELAHLCHMSVSSFKRKFKETFDETPKKYITRKKLDKAAELLHSEAIRVSDVAYDVGFESIATFNRNFTRQYGLSPSEYRLNFIEK
jgi:AraC-like DNA-binding protein